MVDAGSQSGLSQFVLLDIFANFPGKHGLAVSALGTGILSLLIVAVLN